MSRSTEDIQESMVDTYTAIDPSIDTSKGPAYDIVIRPVAPEVAKVEGDVEHLTSLYSRVMAETATDEEADAFATSFGLTRSEGERSKGFVYFYKTTRPDASTTITIPRGTMVTNSDSTLAYQTTEEASIVGAYAESYYNSARNMYEVRVPVEAVASSSDYDIPAYRILLMPTRITGIDGVENRDATTGGTSSETSQAVAERTTKAFEGRDSGTPGGVESIVRNYSPTLVDDVSIVQPKDRTLFTRRVTKPAMDIYVIGEEQSNGEYIFTAAGGEYLISLPLVPAIQVDSVQVNGQSVSFTFLPDTSTELRKSADAVDKVLLAAQLTTLDVCDIKYVYNKLIRDLQDEKFSDEGAFFNTDMLVREAVGAYITYQSNAKIASSFDPVQKQEEITEKIYELIQQNAFVDEYVPSIIRDTVKSSVAGILEYNITKFTRTVDGTSDLETITFAANEKPMLDSATFDLSIRQ